MTEETATPRVDPIAEAFNWWWDAQDMHGISMPMFLACKAAAWNAWLNRSREVAALTTQRDELQKRIDSAVPSGKPCESPPEVEWLRAFALAIMECWPEGDVDGAYLQEMAIKHGLIKSVVATEACNKDPEGNCWCAEYHGEFPVDCFRYTPLLATGTAQATECETNGTEGLRAELDAAKRALAELVACKDLKERIIELADPMNWRDPPELSALNAEYKSRQPLAWEAARAALAAKSTEQKEGTMSDDQIKYMVDRFLGWRLPEHFSPDCGISFKKIHSENGPWGPQKHEPIGTNLFDAMQAEAMIRYLVDGMPSLEAELDAARYQFLKPLYTCIDFEYSDSSEGPTPSIVFAIPPGSRWSGNLDASIDAAMEMDTGTDVDLVKDE